MKYTEAGKEDSTNDKAVEIRSSKEDFRQLIQEYNTREDIIQLCNKTTQQEL